ncbi:UNVERIFIED_CONTAM: hypothetical protein N8J90_09195 [Halobacillus marinus]
MGLWQKGLLAFALLAFLYSLMNQSTSIEITLFTAGLILTAFGWQFMTDDKKTIGFIYIIPGGFFSFIGLMAWLT